MDEFEAAPAAGGAAGAALAQPGGLQSLLLDAKGEPTPPLEVLNAQLLSIKPSDGALLLLAQRLVAAGASLHVDGAGWTLSALPQARRPPTSCPRCWS